MADPNQLLVSAAENLLRGTVNYVGSAFGNTDAMTDANIEQLLRDLGYMGGPVFSGDVPPTITGTGMPPVVTGAGGGGGTGMPPVVTGAGGGGGTGMPPVATGTVTGNHRITVNPTVLGGVTTPTWLQAIGRRFKRIGRGIVSAVKPPTLPISMTSPMPQPAGLQTPTPNDGSVAAVFVLWQDKILIQKRLADPDTVSCPSGILENGETFEAAAIRELTEEAQITPVPNEADLTLFYRTQIAGPADNLVDFAFYYVLMDKATPVDVTGPQTSGEVDTDYTFTDVPNADVTAPESGHAWVSPHDLFTYVEDVMGGAHGPNPKFAEAVSKFLEIEDEAFGRGVDDINLSANIPDWVPPEYFTRADVPQACDNKKIIGPDCLAQAVLRDIMVAEQFKKSLRLRKRMDSALKTYNEKAQELAALKLLPTPTDDQKERKLELIRELDSGFPDKIVHIRTQDDGQIHEFKVVNPYRALAYREDRRNPINFANPAGYGGSEHDPDRVMYGANLLLLNEVAPPEMIADSAMATALLESLWFCGANPTLSNDPRCYPAKILGELREWQANKEQSRAHEEAEKVLNSDSSWGVTKQIFAAMKLALQDDGEFAYIDLPTGLKRAKKSVASATGPTSTAVASTPVSTTPMDASPILGPTASTVSVASGDSSPGAATTVAPIAPVLPPVMTGGRIVPLRLGGIGFGPIIPITLVESI
jgi:ADP-ribose pyrophosphatase YjhB (NUDIX family)